MQTQQRVKLIRWLRDELTDLSYENAQLVMLGFDFSFEFESASDWWDNRIVVLNHQLLGMSDDDLVLLASYFSSEVIDEAASSTTRATTGSREPLQLFASHQSDHKGLVAEVATALEGYGIGLFVAHEDIVPDRDWINEIVDQLGTVDGGVAFLHTRFKSSDWCAQEVGWLLGRGVPVISLGFEIAPYGPLGQRQAIAAAGKSPTELAGAVIDALVSRPELLGGIASSLVKAMRDSPNFRTTDAIWKRLRDLRNLDGQQCQDLLAAVTANSQIHRAHSPHDDGGPYKELVREFMLVQPGMALLAEGLDTHEAQVLRPEAHLT